MPTWFVFHLALGLLGTWLAMRYAIARNLLDHPGTRRSHQVATPRGGGTGIVLALLIAGLLVVWRDPQSRWILAGFGSGLLLVAGVGMVDDHRPLPPAWRLLVQFVAATLYALALVANAPGDWQMGVMAFAAIMVLTNVWNFMDGINGLAASQAVLVAGALAMITEGPMVWVAAALAAASLGFLPYNFPKARIFLGDVGSGAIGFTIAAVSLAAIRQTELGAPSPAVAFLVLVPLSAFLIDASLTLLRRIIRGERWWTPHTQHAYQVWARRVGHATVSMAYGAWTLLACLLMLYLRHASDSSIVFYGSAWFVSGVVLWQTLQVIETRNPSVASRLGKDQE